MTPEPYEYQERRLVDDKIKSLEARLTVLEHNIHSLGVQSTAIEGKINAMNLVMKIVAGCLVLILPLIVKWNFDLGNEVVRQGKISAATLAVIKYQQEHKFPQEVE